MLPVLVIPFIFIILLWSLPHFLPFSLKIASIQLSLSLLHVQPSSLGQFYLQILIIVFHSQHLHMKIQCDVCNKDEASVFCTADEAALCDGCDHRVHHANKLASKHQRFSLIHPSSSKLSPLCDICQVFDSSVFVLITKDLGKIGYHPTACL